MQIKKKIFWGLLSSVGIVLLSFYLLLTSYQRKLVDYALQYVNTSYEGHLVIDKSEIRLFHFFPHVTIDLKGVRFYSDKTTKQKPLYEIRDLYIGFSIIQLIQGNYTVQDLEVNGGYIDIIHELDGTINILNAKKISEDTSETSVPLYWKIHRLDIQDFHLSNFYKKDSTHEEVDIHSAEGKLLYLDTIQHADIVVESTVSLMNGQDSTFFSNKPLMLDLHIDFRVQDSLIVISPSKIKLEEASFLGYGTIHLGSGRMVDVSIEGDKPDFSTFAAFAPHDVAVYLKQYKNEGTIFFHAKVNGSIAKDSVPHVHVDFGCENGYFMNTDINKKIHGIGFKGYYTNGADNCLRTSILQINNVSARPDKGIFSGDLIIANFENPTIAINLHSDLQLEFIGQFFKIEGLKQLKGNVYVDMRFNELIDITVPENNLVRLKQGVDSDLRIKDLYFTIPGFKEPVRNMNIHAQMRKGFVDIDTISFQLGKSDFFTYGSISDLPALFHHHQKRVELKLGIHSNFIKVADFLRFNPTLADSITEEIRDLRMLCRFKTSVQDLLDHPALPMGEFIMDDFYAQLKNYPHTIHDVQLDVFINDSSLVCKKFNALIDKADVQSTFKVDNYRVWFDSKHKGRSIFTVEANSKHLYFKDILKYNGVNYLPKEYKEEEIKNAHIDGRIVLEYDSILRYAELELEHASGKLKMHPIRIDQLKGHFHYEQEHLTITDFIGKMGQSDWKINLSFFAGKKSSDKKRDNYFTLQSNALNMDELLSYQVTTPKTAKEHEEAFNIFTLPFTDMVFRADVKKLQYHGTAIELLKGKVRMQKNHYLYVDTMSMKIAHGAMNMKGYFNGSDPKKIYYKSVVDVDHIHLDELLLRFDNFGQDYVLNKNIKGVLTGKVVSNVRMHPDLVPIIEASEAKVQMRLDRGELIDYEPLLAMKDYFKDKNIRRVRFDTLRSTLHFEKNTLYIDRMQINSTLGYMEVEGKQNLNTQMDYHISVPLSLIAEIGMDMLFKGKPKEGIDPDHEDALEYRDPSKKEMMLHLQVTGTPDNYTISKAKRKKR
ncbi:MAG: AsmA-like C-terminal region-containing protein [Cytophagaceae bacterium]|jgi:hypothetical protein|nr:AsmA-like C-terminal region-containing protein [Cytophagaceae bacterium]